MKIAIGADHGGYELKKQIIERLSSKYEFIDCGTYDGVTSTDYPDFACKTASKVKNKEADYGIVICRSGIGVSIVANKIKGIRCALVFNEKIATLCKEHNNANVIALAADFTTVDEAIKYIQAWTSAFFLGGRHLKRLSKIDEYENR